MHYVRFLKQPILRQVAPGTSKKRDNNGTQKASPAVQALITLETDLGDSIFYDDIGLSCIVIDESTKGKTGATSKIARMEVQWPSGARSLNVEVSMKGITAKELASKALRLRIGSSPKTQGVAKDTTLLPEHDRKMSMPILIAQTSGVINSDGTAPSGRVQVERPLSLGNGKELSIWEDAGVSMARHVWDAGVALVTYLTHLSSNEHRGLARIAQLINTATAGTKLHVLELGAGVGTAGMAFASLVPNTKVIITDVSEAERLVALNIASNTAAKGSSAQFETLDWSEAMPQTISSQTFEIVLVADCIYNETSIPALVSTLSALAVTSPKMVVLIATKTRHESEAIFFELAKKAGFDMVAKDHMLAPAGYTEDDLKEAELIDFYEFVFSSSKEP